MLRKTMIVLATAAALAGGLTADAFALATARSNWDGIGGVGGNGGAFGDGAHIGGGFGRSHFGGPGGAFTRGLFGGGYGRAFKAAELALSEFGSLRRGTLIDPHQTDHPSHWLPPLGDLIPQIQIGLAEVVYWLEDDASSTLASGVKAALHLLAKVIALSPFQAGSIRLLWNGS